MTMVMTQMMTVIVLLIILMAMTMLISSSSKNQENQKSSSFECGFEPFSYQDHSFSMPFFIISLMFLLFDVEIILILVKPLNEMSSMINMMNCWMVLVLISWCTMFEWKKGILKWI